MTDLFFSGALCMGFFVISLFFARFWRNTRDRLFLFFAAAFLLLAAERIVRCLRIAEDEWMPAVYLLRLAAFLIIITGIYDKNRRE